MASPAGWYSNGTYGVTRLELPFFLLLRRGHGLHHRPGMRPPGSPGPRTGRGTTAERRHTPRRVAETCPTFCQCGRPSDRWLSLGQVGASGAPPVYRGRTPLKRGHFAVSPAVLTAINKQKKSARREAAGREWARLSVVLLSLPPSGPSHGTVVLPASSACSGRWSASRSVFCLVARP